MRSSYSMPSAFISAMARLRASRSWARSTWRGCSSVDSIIEMTSRAYVSLSGSSSSSAASRKGESGWSRAKSSGRSTVVKYSTVPSSLATFSTTPASMRVENTSSVRARSLSFSASDCMESSTSLYTRVQASPPCSTSASTMELVMRMRGVSVAGTDSMSLSKFCLFQPTKPSGGFFVLMLRAFLGSPPALARAFARSMSYSVASAMTRPSVSKPARPARPAIWWNSREPSLRMCEPSNLARAVSSTVWMGTLIPTPSVSVPQMTGRRPCWASFSTSRR